MKTNYRDIAVKYDSNSSSGAAAGMSSSQPTQDDYCMEHNTRGACFILAFDYLTDRNDRSNGLDGQAVAPRPSASMEAEMCKASFKSLGFNVKLFMNLKAKEFKNKVRPIIDACMENVDAFALVLIGRAVKDKAAFLVGDVDFKNIWKTFLLPKLESKPKLVIIDMNADHARSGASRKEQEHYHLPSVDDVLVFVSSVSGAGSEQIAQENGEISPFIDYLTKALNQKGHSEDIASVFNSVKEDVCARNKNHKKPAQPFLHNTLKKTLRFPRADLNSE